MKTRTKINVCEYKDEDRIIYAQYTGDSFYLMHQDKNEMSETAVAYSFEAFVRTFKVMKYFFEELCLNDKEALSKLSKMTNKNSKITLTEV